MKNKSKLLKDNSNKFNKKNQSKCANPLFYQWLTEWQLESQRNNNVNLMFVYRKAAQAMLAHPFPFNSAKETEMLSGIGKTISSKLELKLQEFISKNGKNPLIDFTHGSTICDTNNDKNVDSKDTDEKENDSLDLKNHSHISCPSFDISSVKNHKAVIIVDSPTNNMSKSSSLLRNFIDVDVDVENDDADILFSSQTSTMSGVIPRMMNNSLNINDDQTDALSETTNALNKNSGSYVTSKPNNISSLKNYVPKYRSGSYAILLALLDLTGNDGSLVNVSVEKSEIILKAQRYTDTSFTLAGTRLASKSGAANICYTAWSSMAQLVGKGFVQKIKNISTGSRTKYHLTDEGYELAHKLKRKNEQMNENLKDVMKNEYKSSNLNPNFNFFSYITDETDLSISQGCEKEAKETDHLSLPSGTFDIVLVIDQREVHPNKDSTAMLSSHLAAEGIPFVFRILPIGDFVWICKSKKSDTEVTLDYIIERKREDDMIGSISDGRFEEQKFRLSRSGIGNIIYIIERYTGTTSLQFGHNVVDHFGKGRFLSALMQTQVIDGFYIKKTDGFMDTLSYLVSMTRALTAKYSQRDIFFMRDDAFLMTYEARNASASLQTNEMDSVTPTGRLIIQNKSILSPIYHTRYEDFSRLHSKHALATLQDLYLKQLTCIKMMTPERASSIASVYPTLVDLIDAYEGCTDDHERKTLLRDIIYEMPNKKIGDKLSERVYEILYLTMGKNKG